jgi:vacuolar-type H+-ATPase subunit H
VQQGKVVADDSPEQMELRLTGLVVRQQGQLRVANRIYQAVFNTDWVEKELANLRPYAEAFTAWLASNCQDDSRLLRGQALRDALTWSEGKSLGNQDYQFLAASQQKELEAERQAKQILTEAKQKAEQLHEEAREGTRLERAGVNALRVFEAGGREIEALLAAMQAGQALQNLVARWSPIAKLPRHYSPLA